MNGSIWRGTALSSVACTARTRRRSQCSAVGNITAKPRGVSGATSMLGPTSLPRQTAATSANMPDRQPRRQKARGPPIQRTDWEGLALGVGLPGNTLGLDRRQVRQSELRPLRRAGRGSQAPPTCLPDGCGKAGDLPAARPAAVGATARSRACRTIGRRPGSGSGAPGRRSAPCRRPSPAGRS